jgi:hypothetical protein
MKVTTAQYHWYLSNILFADPTPKKAVRVHVQRPRPIGILGPRTPQDAYLGRHGLSPAAARG